VNQALAHGAPALAIDRSFATMLRLRPLLLTATLFMLPFGAGAEALRKDSPTVLITGANRGIGLELARQYAAGGWNVIATSRHPTGDPGLAALSELAAKYPQVVVERLDVTDTAMIRGLAAKYRAQPIDVLINNAANVTATFAGDMEIANKAYDQIDFDAARRDFDVNSLGPMRVAQAFMPNVEKSKQKKLINVTSLAGSFGQPLPNATAMNYGASKAALNKYTVLLSIAMRPKGVIVALVQPIFVASKTDLTDMPGAAPLDQEVAKLIKTIDRMTLDRAGKISNWSTGRIDPF
jgi:NAD(P)-dependent dehydrogenase (short-subunit alcohol dehydrogenase family)